MNAAARSGLVPCVSIESAKRYQLIHIDASSSVFTYLYIVVRLAEQNVVEDNGSALEPLAALSRAPPHLRLRLRLRLLRTRVVARLHQPPEPPSFISNMRLPRRGLAASPLRSPLLSRASSEQSRQ